MKLKRLAPTNSWSKWLLRHLIFQLPALMELNWWLSWSRHGQMYLVGISMNLSCALQSAKKQWRELQQQPALPLLQHLHSLRLQVLLKVPLSSSRQPRPLLLNLKYKQMTITSMSKLWLTKFSNSRSNMRAFSKKNSKQTLPCHNCRSSKIRNRLTKTGWALWYMGMELQEFQRRKQIPARAFSSSILCWLHSFHSLSVLSYQNNLQVTVVPHRLPIFER